jgi:hypothetical protein
VQSSDVDSTFRVVVTASNAAGSTVAASAPTPQVVSVPTTTTTTTTTTPTPTVRVWTFSGALNAKNPVRTFNVSLGTGTAHAELSFSKCSSLSLRAYGESGTVGSTSGPSLVVMTSDIAAGPYTYEVSGGRCSFTLTLTAPSG